MAAAKAGRGHGREAIKARSSIVKDRGICDPQYVAHQTEGHISIVDNNGPDLIGVSGMGTEIGAVLRLGRLEQPRSYNGRDPAVVNILLTKRSYG